MHREVLFATLGLVLTLLAGCQSASALAQAGTREDFKPIRPSDHHSRLDKTIANLLSYYHYRQSKLSDKQSSAIFDAYLDALDFNRGYFLKSDVRALEKYRERFDDYLKSGNLEPAYEVFNVYLRRLAGRTAQLQSQLQQGINFSIDENLELDREDQPWAKSQRELDEFWRKRLKNELLQLILAGKDQAQAKATLQRRYEGRLRRTAQYTSEDVFQIYMNAVAVSFDPHTSYFSPRATENFNIQMSLSLEGIGTVLRMEDEQITVVELVPGGPADLSGQLHPDNRIVGVGQGDSDTIVDVIGWRLDDVVDLIRGPRGTVVRLDVVSTIDGGNTTKTIRLVRDKINLEKQAVSSTIKTIPREDRKFRIGIITIPTFYSDFAAAQRGDSDFRSTARDTRRILRELERKEVDGVVIDLRQNGGGSLQEAVELTGLFIPEGPIVQVRNSRGGVEVEEDPDPTLVYDGPLAVLVNRYSASASEIFAGAMQDYGRAIVLGAPTFGKGTVQTLVDLSRFLPRADNPLGQLKLTIAKFYRINGSSTQHRGVIPDILFPSIVNVEEIGESTQDSALPWDEINPLAYQRYTQLESLIPDLRQRHQQRTAVAADFKALIQDIEFAKTARDRTEVSLLRSKRQAERTEAEKRRLERQDYWRSLLGLPPLQEGEDAAADELPDPLLNESTQIVADLAALLKKKARTLVMTN